MNTETTKLASSFDSNCKNESLQQHIELVKKSPSHWELVLNRTDKYNAINGAMYERITQILTEAAEDEELVLLSITGNGKFYSSGTDLADPLKSFSTATTNIETMVDEGMNRLNRFIQSFIHFPKILVAFINGPAIGISVTILALFDGVYSSSSATFALPFVRTALSAEGCSSYLFTKLMGSIHAKEILLFDRQLTAQEAYERGLVTRVIQDNIFLQEKENICNRILSLPKGSLLANKALLQRWNIEQLKNVNLEELKLLKTRWLTDEFAEAIFKFMNKNQKSKL